MDDRLVEAELVEDIVARVVDVQQRRLDAREQRARGGAVVLLEARLPPGSGYGESWGQG